MERLREDGNKIISVKILFSQALEVANIYSAVALDSAPCLVVDKILRYLNSWSRFREGLLNLTWFGGEAGVSNILCRYYIWELCIVGLLKILRNAFQSGLSS